MGPDLQFWFFMCFFFSGSTAVPFLVANSVPVEVDSGRDVMSIVPLWMWVGEQQGLLGWRLGWCWASDDWLYRKRYPRSLLCGWNVIQVFASQLFVHSSFGAALGHPVASAFCSALARQPACHSLYALLSSATHLLSRSYIFFLVRSWFQSNLQPPVQSSVVKSNFLLSFPYNHLYTWHVYHRCYHRRLSIFAHVSYTQNKNIKAPKRLPSILSILFLLFNYFFLGLWFDYQLYTNSRLLV